MTAKEKIASHIRENDRFFLAAHVNPDGDAIGSAVALSLAIEAMGKEAYVFGKDPVPDFYGFLPRVEIFNSSLPATAGMCLILLDCNAPERASVEGLPFGFSIVIDHHETESGFGDLRWVEPGSPAVGLMVFELIKELGVAVTKDMAMNLYTAIALDTGTFRYGNTTPVVFRAAAELVEAGAEPYLIAESYYETWSEPRFRLFSRALESLEVKNGVALIVVTGEMLEEAGASPADTENFSNFPRMIKEVKVSALFRQTDGESFKVSLRSKGELNVARIAEAFGGGGHRNAAGYTIKADIKTAKERLLKAFDGM